MLANTENPSLLFLFSGKSKALVVLSLNMGITVSSSYKGYLALEAGLFLNHFFKLNLA